MLFVSSTTTLLLSLPFSFPPYLPSPPNPPSPNPAGDMFENYCWADDLMNLCRGGYAFTILLTYPIECFVARDVLETAFFRDHQPQPFFRHAVLSVIIAILCMLLSFTTDCLGIVLELNVSRFLCLDDFLRRLIVCKACQDVC